MNSNVFTQAFEEAQAELEQDIIALNKKALSKEEALENSRIICLDLMQSIKIILETYQGDK